MSVQVIFDNATAVKVADYFETIGMATAAAVVWEGLCLSTPYDLRARQKLADLLCDLTASKTPPGSLARSRSLLIALGQSFPTRKLADAYFENLGLLLGSRPKRADPGKIVLGIGAGRCGSTTLAAAVAKVEDACATHENPPLIFWEPVEAQVQFHIDRLRLLADYFSLVFDASHWWLNAIDRVFAQFPDSKAIALVRDTASCVKSFVHIKGKGTGTLNHWALPDNGIWMPSTGDPAYPSFSVSAALLSSLEAAKAAMIERYVTEYNDALSSLATASAGRVLLVRTEELNDPATTARISGVLGAPLTMPDASLNVGNTADGDTFTYRF
jgi:hypothetical protein